MKVGTDGVLLGSWANAGTIAADAAPCGSPRVLDVGTGTGIIALMMAQRYPSCRVIALDIDEDAAAQAAENVRMSPFSGRITVLHQRIQDHAEGHEGRYNAIVSNPPYFIDSLRAPEHTRQVARHAETLTYGELMASARRLLTDDGELSVIIPFDYRQRMEDEAIFHGLFLHRSCAVSTTVTKPPRRYLLSFVKHPCRHEAQAMTIGDDSYQALMADFYL